MTTLRALSETWAENALQQIPKLPSGDALAQWIVDSRFHIADCARHAPEAVAKVRAALNARDREIEVRAAEIRHGVG